MTNELATIISAATIQPIIETVTNAVSSQHTKRAYSRALTDFLVWHQATGHSGLTKATVQAHVAALRSKQVSASSINQRLTAIRKLAVEAADNGMIEHSQAQAIGRVEGIKQDGKRLGNWLSKAQAQSLLDAPDTAMAKGLRDRAILAVLLGCGLRREECAGLTFEHIQQREGRWVIVDLVGKRNKLRSVPMPAWAKASVDAWAAALRMNAGYIFRPMRRGGHVQGGFMTAQAIFDVVGEYAAQLGIPVKPHDLRRSFAKLAHKGNAPIEQIQLSLGHASIQTTERYLGVKQDLTTAPCDVLGLRI
jgi:site-specific recombinase XerD